MPTNEDIANQQELLVNTPSHISSLPHQEAAMGLVNVSPSIVYGISEARDNIRQIKENFHKWRSMSKIIPMTSHIID